MDGWIHLRILRPFTMENALDGDILIHCKVNAEEIDRTAKKTKKC